MKNVYIGKVVNTHGIKGEIRILSDFKYKDEVFIIGQNLIIDDISYKIKSYRKHKSFDMVLLNEFDNINDVLFLKNKKVYTERKNIKSRLIEDLIGYDVKVNNIFKGKVTDITKNKVQEILVVDNKYLVLYLKEFIENIDDKNKIINVKEVGGIFDEN